MKDMLLGVLLSVIVLAIIAIPMTLWTSRTMSFWLDYFGKEDCSTWTDYGLSLLGPIALLGNLISEIARMFV